MKEEVGDELKDVLDVPMNQLPANTRSSGLSFQCSGEADALAIFSDEAAWLRSSLSYHRLGKPSKLPLQSSSSPYTRDVQSWLSDTSSCGDDHEDLLVSLLYR
jgi:hypothetical protein